MGIMRFNYRSQAIGCYVDISIVYPTDLISYYDMEKGVRHHDRVTGKRLTYVPGMKFQTVYLIHGGGDDDSLTYRYTNAENYAQRNHVMLVTPNIKNSFGVDTCYGVDYSTFLTDELPVVVQSLFASSSKREDNFIMGYAMGGNVALGTALVRPDLYSVCVDMSGGIGLTVNVGTLQDELRSDHFIQWKLYGATFGDAGDLPGSRFDMRAVAQQNLDRGVKLPKFYLIAGSEEGFIGDRVKADADTLTKMGYDITYICVPGHKHDFDLWDLYIRRALDELLPLKREPIYPGK
jgi:putative tributyrin esterase